MPELPEVETVSRGLEKILNYGHEQILKIQLSPQPLRVSPSTQLIRGAQKQYIHGIRRVAKYLIFELDRHMLLSHLGMTGSWRILDAPRKHDHVFIELSSGRSLVFNDPRRFGMFDILSKDFWEQDLRLAKLGRDPVQPPYLKGSEVFAITRGKKTSIKALIMNQVYIVGVGNIYASEALFLSGIHPLREAQTLSQKECHLLANSIVQVLLDAIEMGGTTLRDFRQAGGSSGYFQNFLLAYGRDREECIYCHTPLQSQIIVGRNSFWCPNCQKI
jgi:formamidopyrimidine-DNA glycosylase